MEISTLRYSVQEDPRSMRAKLARLESAMREHEQIEIPVRHIFAPGLYAREITIPKDILLTGKIHRHGHLNVIVRGDISVLTEHGIQRLTGPCTMVSSAGIKRAGYTHEETVWMTVHATNETDIEKLEAELIAPDYGSLELTAVERDLLCHG